jgi:hypothetical protein
MPGISIAMTAVSTALGMAGQMVQANQQEKSARAQAEYNSQVAANEAATQRQLAQNEIAKGAAERSQQQRNAARQMGEMRANIGASGLTMDSGSMTDLLAESATEHQYDSNIINANAANAAWQHQVGETNALNNQAFADYQKANAGAGRFGNMLSAGGTLLGGVATGIGQVNAWPGSSSPSTASLTGSWAGAQTTGKSASKGTVKWR